MAEIQTELFSIIPNALGKDEVFMGDLNISIDQGCCAGDANNFMFISKPKEQE